MIIYKVTNIVNSMCYIGQTTRKFERRMKDHISVAIKQNKYWLFHIALREFGLHNFKWEIIYECGTKEMLNMMETFKIMVNHSHWTEGGYNMTWGGDGTSGYKFSDEHRRKQGERVSGKNNPMYGHVYTDEEKSYISKCTKEGITVEERKKRSIRMIGKRNPIYGRTRTIEEKALMSKNRKGKLTGKDTPTYKSAPEYLITFPDGHQEIIRGLKTFCRDNKLSRYKITENPQSLGYNVQRL